MSDLFYENLKRTSVYAGACIEPTHEGHKQFVSHTLNSFSERNQRKLGEEQRILSEGGMTTANFSLPSSYSKEIIRLALSDLKILELVRGVVDPNATISMAIPYEKREKAPGDFANFGVVYEGREIPFSGVSLDAETAYMQPMKLALKVSDEVLHFITADLMNWDAWANNISSNATFIKELLQLRLAAEMLRASDSYQALSIENETVSANADGLIKTAQFPIVRPYQARDLAGNVIGYAKNPIVLTLNGDVIPAYDDNKAIQSTWYWRFSNLNLGYIQLVDANGESTGEHASGTISYSQATNLIKFDMDIPNGVSISKHMNSLLDAVGNQIAMLSSHRYSRPEFMLMSAVVNNEITKAEHFVSSLKRNGTDTNLSGDLTTIKGVPTYDTGLPGDLGDNRILLGRRNTTAYGIAKPYQIGDAFQSIRNGRATGEQLAYGQEFSVIYTPSAVCSRYASVLLYNSSTR